MSGREEQENYLNNRCDKIVAESPSIVKKYYASFKNGRTASSRTTYLSYVNIYVNYLKDNGLDINDYATFGTIRPADIDEFLDDYREGKMGNGVKKSNASVVSMYNIVKSFYQFLYNNDYIPKDPFTKVNKPKNNINKKPVYLTKEEIDIVKKEIFSSKNNYYGDSEDKEYWQARDYMIFVLGYRTGLRRSAIAAINVEDINFEENYILVTEKGNVTRECYFGDGTKELLLNWLNIRNYLLKIKKKNCNALFISHRRCRLTPVAVNNIVAKYTIGLDKHITAHKLRATCATNLWEKTGDIYLVAEQLGHKNISNTRKYTDVSSEKRRKAAATLDEL